MITTLIISKSKIWGYKLVWNYCPPGIMLRLQPEGSILDEVILVKMFKNNQQPSYQNILSKSLATYCKFRKVRLLKPKADICMMVAASC